MSLFGTPWIHSIALCCWWLRHGFLRAKNECGVTAHPYPLRGEGPDEPLRHAIDPLDSAVLLVASPRVLRAENQCGVTAHPYPLRGEGPDEPLRHAMDPLDSAVLLVASRVPPRWD